jgi:hypothetical protein
MIDSLKVKRKNPKAAFWKPEAVKELEGFANIILKHTGYIQTFQYTYLQICAFTGMTISKFAMGRDRVSIVKHIGKKQEDSRYL